MLSLQVALIITTDSKGWRSANGGETWIKLVNTTTQLHNCTTALTINYKNTQIQTHFSMQHLLLCSPLLVSHPLKYLKQIAHG
jgi:hypothetical protein